MALSSPRDDAETAILVGASEAGAVQRIWFELPLIREGPIVAVIPLDGVSARIVEARCPDRLFAALAELFPAPNPMPTGSGGPLGPWLERLPLPAAPALKIVDALDREASLPGAEAFRGPYVVVSLEGWGATIAEALSKSAPLRLAPIGLDLEGGDARWRVPRVVRGGGARPRARYDARVYVGARGHPRWQDRAPESMELFASARQPGPDLRGAGFAADLRVYRGTIERFQEPVRWIEIT
jgi:hypothetical protein